jgi:spore coat protein U-like protein
LKNNYRTFATDAVDRTTGALRGLASALVVDAGIDPGKSPTGVPLVPTGQYKDVASGEERPAAGALNLGAWQPVRTAARAAAVTWTDCGAENKVCRFDGTREVRFGSAGVYTSKIVTASTPCTIAVFGDPAHGQAKSCSYASVTTAAPAARAKSAAANGWTACAGEGAICQLSGTNRVRYGTETQNVTKVLTGPVTCSNETFGDPAHGALKTCSYRPGR